MAEVPSSQTEEQGTETITEGYFEEELYVDADSVGAFLIELGKQLQSGNELTLTGDGWRIPFRFREPVELEIEFEGGPDAELEIEIEFESGGNDKAPSLA